MRIAVTGTKGQVVSSLIERAAEGGHEVVAIGRPELDLTDPASVSPALQKAGPDLIVSAAAYTAVDKAESERDVVFAVNAVGAGAVAQAAANLGVPLIHLSTDYVFDGKLERPYRESDCVGPNGVYGTSKLAGEREVLAAHGNNSVVLRVAWIFSPFGSNFVKTMMRLAADRDTVSVVADQIGNPTSALDIADGILTVAANLASNPDPAFRGIFHMTAAGDASWADFAEAIFAISAAKTGRPVRVNRISTADYPTAATRPPNSRLDCRKINNIHGIALRDWHSALEAVIARLQAI